MVMMHLYVKIALGLGFERGAKGGKGVDKNLVELFCKGTCHVFSLLTDTSVVNMVLLKAFI